MNELVSESETAQFLPLSLKRSVLPQVLESAVAELVAVTESPATPAAGLLDKFRAFRNDVELRFFLAERTTPAARG